MVDLQLGRVLDRDHALVVRDEAGDHVEGCRLAGTSAAGHEDVHAAEHGGLQELRHGGAEASLPSEVLHAEHGILELADRKRGAVYPGGGGDPGYTGSGRPPGLGPPGPALHVTAPGR